MKLITAIRMIEERERIKKKAEKEMQRQRMPFGNQFVNMQNPKMHWFRDHMARIIWFMYSPFFQRKMFLH